MIVLHGFDPGWPKVINEDGTVSKGRPFRWQYIDTETGAIMSRKKAKKSKKKKSNIYNPTAAVQKIAESILKYDSDNQK